MPRRVIDLLDYQARQRYPNLNERLRRQAVYADFVAKSGGVSVLRQPILPHPQTKTEIPNNRGVKE